jgi:hypothetical protein
MTNDQLTAMLVERILGWRACRDRFIKSGREWIPKWRFNPFIRLDDAFLLLERTGGTYLLTIDPNGIFTAEVRVGDQTGKSAGDPKASAITLAIARALAIEVLR